MKRVGKYLMMLAVMFILPVFVNAADYKLLGDAVISIEDTASAVYMTFEDYYNYITVDMDNVPSHTTTVPDSNGNVKFVRMNENEYVLSTITYPSESQISNDIVDNITHSVVIKDDSTLKINGSFTFDGANLVLQKNTTLDLADGTLTNNGTITTFGIINGDVVNGDNGKVVNKVTTPTFKLSSDGTGKVIVKVTNFDVNAYYEVFRATSKTGKYTKIGSITYGNDTYNDSKVNVGVAYYYRVRAYILVNGKNVYSSYNTTSGKATLTVGGVKVAATSKSSLKISWSKTTGATGYYVYRATSKTGKYTKVKSTTGLSFTNTGLTVGKTYYYKVYAYKTYGGKTTNGSASAIVSAYPKVMKTTLKAASYDYNAIKVAYTKVSGANGYVIYRKLEGGAWTKVKTTTSLSYVDTKLTTGTEYFYCVKAYATYNKKNYYGDCSEVTSAIPTVKKPVITVETGGRSSMFVQSNKVTGASGIQIYREYNGEYILLDEGDFNSSFSYIDYEETNGAPAVELGGTYSYKVRAYRTVGGVNYYGPYSDVITGTVVPGNPSFTVTREDYDLHQITGDVFDYESGDTYELIVYRKDGSNSYEALERLNVSGNESWSVRSEDLIVGHSYTYAVRSVINGVMSNFNTVVLKATLKTPHIVSLPFNYKTTKIFTDEFISGADGYEFYRATSKTGKYTKLSCSSWYCDNTGTVNKVYYYKVRAYRVVDGKKVYSAWSNIVGQRIGLQFLNSFPGSVSTLDETVWFITKKPSFSVISANSSYVKYKITFPITKSYSKYLDTNLRFSLRFYRYDADDYAYIDKDVSVKVPKGKKTNWSASITVTVPANYILVTSDYIW